MSFWGELDCPRWLLYLKNNEWYGGLIDLEGLSVLGAKLRAKRRVGPNTHTCVCVLQTLAHSVPCACLGEVCLLRRLARTGMLDQQCISIANLGSMLPEAKLTTHNKDVVSLLVGSLLGDGYAEKRNGGVRFILQQESRNVGYIMWFYKYLAERGYCKEREPRREKRIGKGGKIRYFYRMRTYTYNNLIWLYEMFYDELGKKVIKEEILDYMDPLCLGKWIMDDAGQGRLGLSGRIRKDRAGKVSAGMKLATNGFERGEVEKLSEILNMKYKLRTRLHKDGDRAVIYVPKESMGTLAGIVKEVIHPTMKYKLNGYL